MECTVRVAAGEPLASKLTEGAVVCLGPGEHVGPLVVEHTVTLVGDPGAVLTSHGAGPVLTVTTHQIAVTLRGIRIADGYAETGSGVYVDAYASIVLENCVIEGNRESMGPGRGLWMVMGDLVSRDCVFRDDVMISGIATARFEGGRVEALSVGDGAQVALVAGEVGRLSVAGTTSRAPEVSVQGAKIGVVENDPDVPGKVTGR